MQWDGGMRELRAGLRRLSRRLRGWRLQWIRKVYDVPRRLRNVPRSLRQRIVQWSGNMRHLCAGLRRVSFHVRRWDVQRKRNLPELFA